ncbi:MAG: hypothetical protein OHK0040_13260 [bacterium]
MIHRNKLPEDIKVKLKDAKKLLEDDKNIVFAYLFGGFAMAYLKVMQMFL